MRDFDTGKFIRLRNAIQQAIASANDDFMAASGSALPAAYQRFRIAALELVSEDQKAELDAICPAMDDRQIEAASKWGAAPEVQAHLYTEAKIQLGSLAGFLDGYVEETAMRIEAEERARIAAEKPPGVYL